MDRLPHLNSQLNDLTMSLNELLEGAKQGDEQLEIHINRLEFLAQTCLNTARQLKQIHQQRIGGN